jgi:PAS domain S-box-containing protein
VTDNRSRYPGWARMPGRVFAHSSSAARLGPQMTRLWLLARPGAPSRLLGIVVATSLLVVETLVVCSLNVLTDTTGCFATIYLLGVLIIPTLWGFGLSATMSVASAIAFSYFRSWPTAHFSPFALEDWAAIGVFAVVALVANVLAGLAREGERFYDLSPDMLCITGPDRVIRVNPAFKQTLGYSLDDMASRPYLDLIVAEDREQARALLEQLPGTAEPVRFENRVTRSDGSQRWVEWSVAWNRGLFYAVGRDVTERRDAQDRLHQAQVMVEASRDELIASRARIVTAGDEARRRLEHNLHDGAQQRLVSLGIELRMAQEAIPVEQTDLKEQLSHIMSGLTDCSQELQEIARGIHPAVLSKGGLGPAFKMLARRSSVPVTLDVTIDRRLPASIEVAAYYAVAEALTNAAKHAHASEVTVCAEKQDDNLRLLVRDDGIGGANPTEGSGLVGLKDRVEALGGRIQVSSPPRGGTSLHINIPLDRT